MSHPKQSKQVTNFWANNASQMLPGKTISHVEYQTPSEKDKCDWSKRAPVIIFTDGSRLMPVADEELNEAGALILTTNKETQIIPTII